MNNYPNAHCKHECVCCIYNDEGNPCMANTRLSMACCHDSREIPERIAQCIISDCIICKDIRSNSKPVVNRSSELYTLEQVQKILDVVRENAVYNDGDFYFKVDVEMLTNTVRSLKPFKSNVSNIGPLSCEKCKKILEQETEDKVLQTCNKILNELKEFVEQTGGCYSSTGYNQLIRKIESLRVKK